MTDQIITSITTSRQILVTRLIERLDYEADLVINPPPVSLTPLCLLLRSPVIFASVPLLPMVTAFYWAYQITISRAHSHAPHF